MKNCSNCNEPMMEGSKFCNFCGTPADAVKNDDVLKAEEQAVLNKFSTGLKHERLAWKIGGIVSLISTIYFLIGALLIPICGLDAYSASTAHEFVAIVACCLICALCVLPVPIVNFVMMKKLGNYRAKLFTDCKDGIGHCGSVGSIVLAALFNEVALIFVIINFVKAKNNAAVIKRIEARQEAYNSNH